MTLHEYVNTLKDKRITVIGIGVSNRPLIKLLLENGCDVTARDRTPPEKLDCRAELEAMGAKLVLGDGYLKDIRADVIFRTPGIRPDLPEISSAVAEGAELTSEMEAFFKVCPCRIIAVTGSDGKTTTTTLISELLKAEGRTVHVGGNIGQPLLCSADGMAPDDIAVLELSSFQLMTMDRSPDVAVITNLSPNHLDVHRDMDEYVNAKRNIYLHQNSAGRLILNYDNELTRDCAGTAPGKVEFFSRCGVIADGVGFKDGAVCRVTDGVYAPILRAEDIRIPGVHNIENYMAAYAAVEDIVKPETLRSVAREFAGVEHRLELVRELRGVRYINDSIASSPSRTIAGLRSFDQKVILIAGGKDKGVPFDTLAKEVVYRVKKLVLTGYTAEKISSAVMRTPGYGGNNPPITLVDDFRDAVIEASDMAEPGDVVLLSPACTSFDRFKNFAERGNVFKEIVNSLD